MKQLNELLGTKIIKVKLDSNKECLQIITDKGPFTFFAVGECCSTSWVEHINGVDRIIDGVVTELPELYPDCSECITREEEEPDFDYDKNQTEVYITTIKTNKGSMDIEFRNESNGYYRGWLSLFGEPYTHFEIPNDLKEIKEDF